MHLGKLNKKKYKMSGFKIRSGSAVVASTDYIKKGTYIPQAHNQLKWFKSHITNCRISRIFIGWRSLITQKKESIFVHFFNYLTSFIPVYSRKIFQHSLVYCWLENGKKLLWNMEHIMKIMTMTHITHKYIIGIRENMV